ncbi:hypothetical protein GCM10009819_00390 [Agromyces tropicus]|uniref:BatC protein n=1 Tax=Agromyces tropicus TaxID=555371 RepID=A0ABP5F9Y8_9MICO
MRDWKNPRLMAFGPGGGSDMDTGHEGSDAPGSDSGNDSDNDHGGGHSGRH